MVGLAIGLLSALAIAQILWVSEGQKRTAMAGSDAQISGVLALSALRQNIQTAGYGFSSSPSSIGCPMDARFNHAPVPQFPTHLVPVVITVGVGANGLPDGSPDTIRVLSSSKISFSVPVRVIAPGYNPSVPSFSTAFPVMSVRGVAQGDLILAVTDATSKCEIFQVTSAPGSVSQVDRSDDDTHWNMVGYPDIAYGDGQLLVNLGALNDTTYSVGALGTLQANNFAIVNATPSYTGAIDIFANIVNLQAYYGKDTNGDGVVDTWDNITPTTHAGWLQVLAVRVAVVSRSEQYEKEAVTSSNPLWDVGANSTLSGANTCGASKCIALRVDQLPNWQHYRYKVFDSIVALRNMIWTS